MTVRARRQKEPAQGVPSQARAMRQRKRAKLHWSEQLSRGADWSASDVGSHTAHSDTHQKKTSTSSVHFAAGMRFRAFSCGVLPWCGSA
eukprot:182667-Rhodomonas_salina.2